MQAAHAGRRVSRSCSLLAPLMGCSLFNKDDDYVPDDPADKLYNEGLFLLNKKQDYRTRRRNSTKWIAQNPYSDWARKALLMSAYAYYQASEYDDCINAAKRYVDAASRQLRMPPTPNT